MEPVPYPSVNPGELQNPSPAVYGQPVPMGGEVPPAMIGQPGAPMQGGPPPYGQQGAPMEGGPPPYGQPGAPMQGGPPPYGQPGAPMQGGPPPYGQPGAPMQGGPPPYGQPMQGGPPPYGQPQPYGQMPMQGGPPAYGPGQSPVPSPREPHAVQHGQPVPYAHPLPVAPVGVAGAYPGSVGPNGEIQPANITGPPPVVIPMRQCRHCHQHFPEVVRTQKDNTTQMVLAGVLCCFGMWPCAVCVFCAALDDGKGPVRCPHCKQINM